MKFCVSFVSHQSWSGGYQRLERWRPTWRKTPRKKLKTSWCRQSDVQCPREKTVQRTRTIKNKENSCVGAENLNIQHVFEMQSSHGNPVLLTDTPLERIKPVTLVLDLLDGSAGKSKAGITHNRTLKNRSDTNFKHFFLLLCDCFTKCTCTFQFN